MKISKRIKVGILVIFIITLVQTVAFATMNIRKTEEFNNVDVEIVIDEEAKLTENEQKALDLINEYRNENGLESLKPSTELQAVAKIKAEDLVNNRYFAHNSANLGTPFEMLDDNGVIYRTAGENLAGNITPERAVEAWKNSPSHNENILTEDFEYTGIYEIDSDIYGKVYVQLFIGM